MGGGSANNRYFGDGVKPGHRILVFLVNRPLHSHLSKVNILGLLFSGHRHFD